MADQQQDYASPPQATNVALSKALFTQSDWSGPVSVGSWFGHHNPWRRIFAFMVLSSWSWTIATLYQLYVFQSSSELGEIPILQARTKAEMDLIKETHQDCVSSLCETVGRTAPIDCIVNDDGVTSRVEYGDDITDPIQFPMECHDAIEVTFGQPYLAGLPDQEVPPVAFISLQKEGKWSNETDSTSNTKGETSLLTLLPDCSIMISDPDVSPAELQALKEKLGVSEEWNDLYKEFQQQNNEQSPVDITFSIDLLQMASTKPLPPGHRETNVLKNILCVDEMPEDIQQQALPQLAMIYNFLMDYRQELLTVLLYASNLCFSFLTVGWLMFRLIIPSMVMKRVLAWPTTITFWDIWRTLLLLCLTTSFRLTSPVLAGLLAGGAMLYGNFTAAMEWSFLGMLAWAATDTIYPFLDDLLGNQLAKLDALNILYFTLHLFVIGEGWWKLVTLYVVYRSYQALWEKTMRQTPTRAPLQQNQLHLQEPRVVNTNGHQPQQAQAQQAHVKVD